jgi:5-hydroxyisourate hydrolase-like protein (transthyretin family)
MGRPLTFLIVAMAVGCAALFLLLPMSKLAQQGAGIEASRSGAPQSPIDDRTLAAQDPVAPPQPVALVEISTADTPVEMTVPVSGSVSNAFGSTLPGIDIEFENKGFDGEEIVKSLVVTDRFGEFTLQLVPARQYRLSIGADGNYAGYTLDGFTAKNAKRLQNIVLERVELVDVDGLIVDTDLLPVANFELILRHLLLDYPDRSIRSDSSGYFSLRGFPAGEVRIATSQSDYFRIKGVELRPGEYRNLTLMIDRGSYHLSGWVRDANGTPMADVIVTLKSAFATDEYHSFSYRSVATDSNGIFEFAGLGGHQLTLGIYAPGFATHIQQHDFTSFSDNIDIVLERD